MALAKPIRLGALYVENMNKRKGAIHMAEFFEKKEQRRALLIEELLSNGVYKTSDEKHLYDAPLKALEDEYKIVIDKSGNESPPECMT
ncbi:Fur-regulated basic protein FbpA [Peribacillus sp. NPDC097264]|uniref:Fur-regulated basic protein FbpA n=2 Tax=Peribacillus TaxID=2675229 RepID=UPI0038193A05